MATRKTAVEVAQIRKGATRKGLRKPIFFGTKINDLKVGEGLLITNEEWAGTNLKTPLPSYYYGKYNKGGFKQISCVKTHDGYLIEKIAAKGNNQR